MASRRMEFFIGMMVIGVVAGVFAMTLMFGSQHGFFIGGGGGKRMTIEFENGAGLSQNSLVKKNGIQIGRVYDVRLIDGEDNSKVSVSFELDPKYKIYSNEYAKITRTLVGGEATIEFVKNPNYKDATVELNEDAIVQGVAGGDIMGTVDSLQGDLAQALQNVDRAAEQLTLFMQNLNSFLGDENELNEKKRRLQNVFTELNETLVTIKGLAGHMDEIVSDEELRCNIQTAAQKVPQILERVDSLMATANDLAGDARRTMGRVDTTFDLVDKNLDNVNVFTTDLAEQGPEIMTALNEGAVDVRTMLAGVASLARQIESELNDPNTPIGLLADGETATSLRNVVKNVEALTKNAEELTEKAYPIMDDARVFSNKIAHRPSSLIWDRTASKGVPTSTSDGSARFGLQSNSPSGGVSSPLYRRTPSGARVCERKGSDYRYEPGNADLDAMDVATRIEYENAYSDARATASPKKWSIGKFWDKIFAKRANESEPEYLASEPTFAAASPVGYFAPEGVPANVGNAVYGGYWETPTNVGNAVYSDFGGNGVENVSSGVVSNAGTVPNAVPNAVRPPEVARSLGPYPDSAPTLSNDDEPLDFGLADELCDESNVGTAPRNVERALATEIEELPSSINRVVGDASTFDSTNGGYAPVLETVPNAVPSGASNGAFEDDGLPMMYAPPTER